MNRIASLALTLALAGLLICGWAASPARAQDTSAVAVNTRDGSDLLKVAFQIRHTMNDVVDQTNAAVAYASCEECQTVAISFQVVLAGGDADTVTPTNLALALNQDCTTCETAAFAYQFVTSGDTVLRFTAEGNRRLAELRRRLHGLRRGDLTLVEIDAAVADITEQLRDVLAHELVSVGRPDESRSSPEEPTPTPSPSPEPSESPTSTPTATPTITPSPTATPTTTPAPEPEPTVTPAP